MKIPIRVILLFIFLFIGFYIFSDIEVSSSQLNEKYNSLEWFKFKLNENYINKSRGDLFIDGWSNQKFTLDFDENNIAFYKSDGGGFLEISKWIIYNPNNASINELCDAKEIHRCVCYENSWCEVRGHY